MRLESSVTSLSWIPSEAVAGVNKPMFEMGVAHYDDPPPDVIEDLDALRDSDRVPVREPARGVGRRRGRQDRRTPATAAAA